MQVKLMNLIVMCLSAWIIGLVLAIVGKIVIDACRDIERTYLKP